MLLAALLIALATVDAISSPSISIPASRMNDPQRPGVKNCTERYFDQKMDHFEFGPLPAGVPNTFSQRYYTCLESTWQPGNPIFYYTGNEVDVTLFVESTGLMWENAQQFGAMLIFAEHRYFGESLPFPGEKMPAPPKLKWLTVDQALADYATHIEWFRHQKNATSSPVIGFGGSYGGMLCSWLRIKYPSSLTGCIAGSAPIANFLDLSPPYDAESFQAQVTFDASTAGGSNDLCKDNIRQSFRVMTDLAETSTGRQQIASALTLCAAPSSAEDVYNVFNWINEAYGYMAMSSYPYPSNYLLLGGGGVLPAYPVRVSCEPLSTTFTSNTSLLAALQPGMNLYYNATGAQQCFNVSKQPNEETLLTEYLWGYLSCTTMFMPSSQDGIHDMFWPAPWNTTAQIEACQQSFGTTPQPDWVEINYGGKGVSAWGSNIVFSNGQLDPWRPGGILNATSPNNVVTLLIAESGHHIDLMFSDPKDTTAIKDARKREVRFMQEVIAGGRPH